MFLTVKLKILIIPLE